MGNSSSSPRDHASRSHPSGLRYVSSSTSPGTSSPRPGGGERDRDRERERERERDRNVYSSRSGRGSRHDLSFLHLGRDRDSDRERQPEPRRETRQEREARKIEKERIAREKERQRSVREEGVDGGYLVTLGTYTGPEDFNKTVVRQLMVSIHVRHILPLPFFSPPPPSSELPRFAIPPLPHLFIKL